MLAEIAVLEYRDVGKNKSVKSPEYKVALGGDGLHRTEYQTQDNESVQTKNFKMQVNELLNSGVNLSVTMTSADLKSFAADLISQTRRELESVIMDEKAEKYLTVKDVTEMLKVNASTIWRWQQSKYLMPLEVGGSIRYKLSDIKAVLNARTKSAAAVR